MNSLFTIGIVLSYLVVLALGYLLGVITFVERRNVGEMMVIDDKDQVVEIQFKQDIDPSILHLEYIVLHINRDAK